MSDEVTIDVGPVSCPSCKREFGNTERDRLASLLEKLRPYLSHANRWCPAHPGTFRTSGPGPCDCGLSALLAEIGDEK